MIDSEGYLIPWCPYTALQMIKMFRSGHIGIPSVSFAWTTDALLAEKKIATRRDWDVEYARRFANQTIKTQQLFLGTDKGYRNGGKAIALLQLRSLKRQPLSLMTEQDLIEEGGLWRSVEEFKGLFTCTEPYVLKFRPLILDRELYLKL